MAIHVGTAVALVVGGVMAIHVGIAVALVVIHLVVVPLVVPGWKVVAAAPQRDMADDTAPSPDLEPVVDVDAILRSKLQSDLIGTVKVADPTSLRIVARWAGERVSERRTSGECRRRSGGQWSGGRRSGKLAR